MAKILKLIEVTDAPWDQRWIALQQILKKDFDVDFTFEIKSATPETFDDVVKDVLKSDADVCHLSNFFAPRGQDLLYYTTHEAAFAGAAPYLVRDPKGHLHGGGKDPGQIWWPHTFLEDAFVATFSDQIKHLDLSSNALVVGCGGIAKLVIGALAKLGLTNVNIADASEADAKALSEEMKRKYFQMVFNYIPAGALTTLPGNHTIVVNTMVLSLENELLDDLYFFNFLKLGGIVVDMTLVPARTPLISEAEQWGARHLSGDYIFAQWDRAVISKVLGLSINVEEYRKSLRALIDAVPFDGSPYLKRFRERGN